MAILPFFLEHQQDFAKLRRDIHAHPETAFSEVRTAEIIRSHLTQWGYDVTSGIGKTGLVASYKNGEGPSIGLRADMDALDLQEKNTFDHCSVYPGKMHGCGHDGHTVMLLAAARYLAEKRPCKGTVHLIFQPAEENEGGATAMIQDGLFERFPMDSVFSMHNFPGLPVGQFAVRPGSFMAAFEMFDIVIKGQGGHSAAPHMTHDPIVVAGQLISAMQSVVSRNLDPMQNGVLSITQIHGGSTYNVIPEQIELSGSLRYFDVQTGNTLRERMQQLAQGIANAHCVDIECHFDARYIPLVNDYDATELAVKAMKNVAGESYVNTNSTPITGSEDFAFMLREKPGCYVLIGNGTEGYGGCMIHNPNYDFNDDVIPLGASYWVELCQTILGE